jgi:hypothetical protein
VPPPLREIVSGCLAKDPAARPTPAALATALAGRDRGTGPSAVAFWPRSVAGVIGAYQARLEQETKSPGRPTREMSWTTVTHTPTTPANPGNGGGAQGSAVAAGPGGTRGYTGAQGAPGSHGAPGSPGAQGAPGSHGAPGAQGAQGPPHPRGYSPSQGYPQPQGYGGAGAPQPPPRGYVPGAGQPGYPMPYQVGRVPLGPLPESVRNAVRLMYAGAAYTAVYAIGVIVVAGAIIKKTTTATGSGHTTVAGVAVLTVLLSLVEIGVWVGLAQACRNGKNWARVTGTVLFGLQTIGFLGVLANSHPGIGLTKVLTGIGWLIGLGAVVFLWQRPSGAFFNSRAPISR